jgi:hypothetical protein
VDTISEHGWQPEHTAGVLNTLAELSMCAAHPMPPCNACMQRVVAPACMPPHVGLMLRRPDAAKKPVMQRALRIAARAQLTDIPTIAHQLLLFCSAGLIGQALQVPHNMHCRMYIACT